VTQSRTGAPSGNCTEATIASLLGCRLEEVPVLWSGNMNAKTLEEAQPPERLEVLNQWLEERGLIWVNWTFAEPVAGPIAAEVYERSRGPWPNDDSPEYWLGPAFGRPHIIGGFNPDGVPHFCVGMAGKVLWDPNPLRRGLATIDSIAALFHIGGGPL